MSFAPRSASPVNSTAPTTHSHRLSSVQQDSDSLRRHSRLPELLTRKRTSSTPYRKDKDGAPVLLPTLSLFDTTRLIFAVLPEEFLFCEVQRVCELGASQCPLHPFTAHPSGSSSFVTYEAMSPSATSEHSASTASPSSPHVNTLAGLPKRARGSLILPSGISLPFSRSRSKYKKSRLPPPPPTQFLFSEVIEISAPPPPPPEEDEDRERLRDAAAQSIGLDPVLLEERESTSSRSHTRSFSLSQARSERSRSRSRSKSRSRSVSPVRSRARAGSRAGAETPAVRTLPPFPATYSALAPWVQRSSKVTKHYPPSSLLHYALAKQWKSRMLVLTSSPSSASASQRAHTSSFSSHSPFSSHLPPSTPQTVAHLHVFKSANGDDRELERIEIGADSVVFISEDEIGGRRGVVKIGGVGGAEMTLSMAAQTQAHDWIAAIKQAVLSERSVRAGLGAVTHSNGVEPRGDIDVMLSMRAQGLFTPPAPAVPTGASSKFTFHNGTTSLTATSSPVPSLRSSSPQHTRPPSAAVSALRGLFGGNRPRSPSSATLDTSFGSIPERGSGAETASQEDTSFGRAGTSLLGMLRSNSISSERPLSPTTPISSSPNTPRVGSTAPADLPIQMGLISPPAPVPTLNQKIVQDKDRDSILPSFSRNGFSGLGLTGLNGNSSRYNGNGLPVFNGSPSLQPLRDGEHGLLAGHPPPRERALTARVLVAEPIFFWSLCLGFSHTVTSVPIDDLEPQVLTHPEP
ncbi:hypothetical protein BN946_scf184801.g59 [Trametes cinnabarina]|uniref:PH domain-containing protein n=1 Tax=Pycnoporus cinnabarinus TaxID=5643 RepID=A0A060S9H9_PYCCI|nr:hypothetical protein BN946_scf184801.g59 [Trametes cinnabarina]